MEIKVYNYETQLVSSHFAVNTMDMFPLQLKNEKTLPNYLLFSFYWEMRRREIDILS